MIIIHKLCFSLCCISLLSACASQKDQPVADNPSTSETAPVQKRSIAETLKARTDLTIEEQAELYRQLRKEDPDGYNWENEDEMTMYGYGYLWGEEPEKALVVFQLIVEHFPESANPYDSVGEAYLAVGDTIQALKNYEKTLAMNPDNYFARDQIARMKDPSFGLPSPSDMFGMKLSAQEAKADIDFLAQKLTSTHPAVFKFTAQEDFEKQVADIKASIADSISIPQLRWKANQIIASVNCSHTGSGRFGMETQMLPTQLLFPVQVRWIDESLFVSEPLINKDVVAAGTEIVAINGQDVASILENIYARIPSQGYVTSTKRLEFNHWSTTLIPYALDFPSEYVITTADGQKRSLRANEEVNRFARNTSIFQCEEPLCLDFPEEKTAHLFVGSFNFYPWNDLDKFVAFMDESFQSINEKGVENLIIDLRGNGGGSPESSIYLLSYLMDEPFVYFASSKYEGGQGEHQPFENRYRGRMVFLIDGKGSSTTGHFMAIVKDRELGPIVGEELGSNHFCTAGQKTFRMENMKAEFYVANNTNWVDVHSIPDHQGVLPDHFVSQSIEDYLKKTDTVLEFGLALTKQ